MSTSEKKLQRLKDYISEQKKKLEPHVYCKCGTKLTATGDSHRAMCPAYINSIAPVSFLTKKHNTKAWGTGKDIMTYEIICEIEEIIKKED